MLYSDCGRDASLAWGFLGLYGSLRGSVSGSIRISRIVIGVGVGMAYLEPRGFTIKTPFSRLCLLDYIARGTCSNAHQLHQIPPPAPAVAGSSADANSRRQISEQNTPLCNSSRNKAMAGIITRVLITIFISVMHAVSII